MLNQERLSIVLCFARAFSYDEKTDRPHICIPIVTEHPRPDDPAKVKFQLPKQELIAEGADLAKVVSGEIDLRHHLSLPEERITHRQVKILKTSTTAQLVLVGEYEVNLPSRVIGYIEMWEGDIVLADDMVYRIKAREFLEFCPTSQLFSPRADPPWPFRVSGNNELDPDEWFQIDIGRAVPTVPVEQLRYPPP